MLNTVLVIALTFAPVAPMIAVAHELDSEQTVSAEQKRLSSHLPQTVIVRESKADGKIEVVHLKEKVAPGQKPADLKFEQIALNSEVRGIAFDSSNELDTTSSTSSWMFALGLGAGLFAGSAITNRAYAGYGAYGYAAPRSYGYGGYSGYGYRSAYAYPSTAYGYSSYAYQPAYYPSYTYAGYNYQYSPYYSYSTAGYNYTYCNWPSYY